MELECSSFMYDHNINLREKLNQVKQLSTWWLSGEVPYEINCHHKTTDITVINWRYIFMYNHETFYSIHIKQAKVQSCIKFYIGILRISHKRSTFHFHISSYDFLYDHLVNFISVEQINKLLHSGTWLTYELELEDQNINYNCIYHQDIFMYVDVIPQAFYL